MLKQTIVKKPGKSYLNGLTTSHLGRPNFDKLVQQHQAYLDALGKCDVSVKVLPASEEYPDSTFVEDAAVLTTDFAVVTNPGAESRNGETKEIATVLKQFYHDLRYIKAPGTLDGGDVLQIDDHFYIGISARTNTNGANQLKTILESEHYQATIVPLQAFFHLKSGIAYLGNNIIVVAGEFIEHPDFASYEKIIVPPEEEYAANCICMNDYVIIPKGFEKMKQQVNDKGYQTIELDMSEFQKQDGGLSCLSLRF